MPIAESVKPEDRAGYIAGLRRLADALETDPQLRLPFTGAHMDAAGVNVYPRSREETTAWVALMDHVHAQGMLPVSNYYEIAGQVSGLAVRVIAPADRLGGRAVRRNVESFEVEPFLPQSVSA